MDSCNFENSIMEIIHDEKIYIHTAGNKTGDLHSLALSSTMFEEHVERSTKWLSDVHPCNKN